MEVISFSFCCCVIVSFLGGEVLCNTHILHTHTHKHVFALGGSAELACAFKIMEESNKDPTVRKLTNSYNVWLRVVCSGVCACVDVFPPWLF